jgi:hypothetical protein
MKKEIKLEDLKNGMKLRSLKRVYYVSKDSLDEGLMLWEELVDNVSCVINIGEIKEVLVEDGEVFLIDEVLGESNEGWYGVEDMLKKGVFEII